MDQTTRHRLKKFSMACDWFLFACACGTGIYMLGKQGVYFARGEQISDNAVLIGIILLALASYILKAIGLEKQLMAMETDKPESSVNSG